MASYKRSKDYRQKFIHMHPPDKHGKYRCVYCGRKIKQQDMQVDHIIPVDAVQHSWFMRHRMKKGVNDISNLVPSCKKCNLKKASKVSLYYRIRARIGSHEGYWVFRKIVRTTFAILIILAVTYCARYPEKIIPTVAPVYQKTIYFMQNISQKFNG